MSGNEGPSDLMEKRLVNSSDAHNDVWEQVLEEMDDLAADRRDDGWEATTVMSVRTNTTSKETSRDGNWGLMHIVPNNFAERFEEAYDEESFTEFLAYGRVYEGFVYLVTELIDPEDERSIFIASRYDTVWAGGMISNVKEEDVLYTHVRTIDGTVLGTFEHEDWEPLLPGLA